MRRVTIRFPADRDNDFYFRVFCWADDTLHPAIVEPGYGVIHDLDRVRETVRIDIRRHRKVAEVLRVIRKTAAEHFPDCTPVVEGPFDEGDAGSGIARSV
jgi:hypothetical protein